MIVSVTGVAGRGLTITPDPVVIKKGERIAWRFGVVDPNNNTNALRYGIYINNGNPFGKHPGSWALEGEPTTSGIGILEAGPATEPGNYKYGVRIADANTGEALSDDDPILVVLPE
jgi:hypothetical protein